MIRQGFVLLLAALLAIEVNSIKTKNLKTDISKANPRDLIDDAEEQLEELKETVDGAITTALNDLEDLGADVLSYGDNTLESGHLEIMQYHETALERLQVIKDLANTAEVNISSCMDNGEELLNIFPTEYTNQMKYCIDTTTEESDSILQDSTYFVDVYITKVNELEFQLGLCTSGSSLCISPIISQIELGMVQLPQNIRVEVDRAQDLLETVKVSIQECSVERVAFYVGDANSLLNFLTNCVNELLP